MKQANKVDFTGQTIYIKNDNIGKYRSGGSV